MRVPVYAIGFVCSDVHILALGLSARHSCASLGVCFDTRASTQAGWSPLLGFESSPAEPGAAQRPALFHTCVAEVGI